MKKLVNFGVISGLLVSSSVFAFNPVDGFYAGILAGVSHKPGSDSALYIDMDTGNHFRGNVGYDIVGGGGGVTLGYKLSHFRLEGEIFYNRISTGPFKMNNDCTLQNSSIFSPTDPLGKCSYPNGAEKFGLAYNGSSNATYGLINLYYNIFADNEHQTVPYIGLGIGAVRISNNSNFPYTRATPPILALDSQTQRDNITANGMAAQGIVGVSYYMDDLTWIGMDYRFTGTGKMTNLGNRSYSLNSIMFNVNFAFDKGAINC